MIQKNSQNPDTCFTTRISIKKSGGGGGVWCLVAPPGDGGIERFDFSCSTYRPPYGKDSAFLRKKCLQTFIMGHTSSVFHWERLNFWPKFRFLPKY